MPPKAKKDELATSKTEEQAITAPVNSFLEENANVGTEEVDATDLRTPSLTLIQRNSTLKDQYDNLLADAHKGQFYYKGDKTIHEKPRVIIMGFTKRELPSYEDKNKLGLNYIILGLFEKTMTPFLFYARSFSIGAFKDLLTDVRGTKRPIWSFVTEISAENAQSQKDGKTFMYYKVRFHTIEEINDMEKLQQLKVLATRYKNVLDNVQGEEKEEKEDDIFKEPPQESPDRIPDDEPKSSENSEDVNPDDVPF